MTGREEAGLGTHEAAGAEEDVSACTAVGATRPPAAAAKATALAVHMCACVFACKSQPLICDNRLSNL